MSEQAERIHAALLRFKAERASAGDQQVKPIKPAEGAREVVVVNEQYLDALFPQSPGGPIPENPVRKLAAAKGM